MGDTEKNHYELLGIEREATTDRVREAYREIARVYHPDSNFYDEIIDTGSDNGALDKFKIITAAYNVLVNPEKRRAYDLTLPGESLQGWGETKDTDEEPSSVRAAHRSTPSAFGTFGHVRTSKKRAQQVEEVQSMADIISRKKNLYRRLLSVFGVK
jgi:DnaJ-class molecular chaperone